MWYKVTDNFIDFRCKLDTSKIGLEAAKLAVENIMKKYPPPYHIMVSGGIDSQATLYSWKLYGKNYIPTFVRFNNDMNSHDFEELKIFSEQENITIYKIDYDLLEFYNTRYEEMTKEYRCPSPQILAHIDMIKNLPGTVIMSGNFLSTTFFYNSVYHALTLESQKRNFIPFFLLSYPELAYTGLVSMAEKKFSDVKVIPTTYDYKVLLYHRNGFPVIPQKTKQSGFEQVKDYFDKHYANMVSGNSKLKYMNKLSKRTFDLLLRYPYEELYGIQPKKVYINQDIIDKSYELGIDKTVQSNNFVNLKKQETIEEKKIIKTKNRKIQLSLENNVFIVAGLLTILGYITGSNLTNSILYVTLISLFLSVIQKLYR